MDNINFKTYNINFNTKNDFIKDNIENTIIDFNKVKDTFNNIKKIDEKYFKYLFPIFFLKTNVKNEDIYNEIRNKNIIENTTYNILKNKFILWPKNDSIFIAYSLFSDILKKCKNYLMITSNFGFIEAIKYYNDDLDITHLEYDNKYKKETKYKKENRWLEDINLIKEKYKFKNYNLESDIDKIINNDKIYDAFLFDLVFFSQYNEEFQDKQKFINAEKQNLFLLNTVSKLLEKLKKGGIFLLLITSMICKETLLLLQSFALCFEKCYIFKENKSIIKYLKFPVFIFINYKKQVKPLSHITTDFYNSIKEFYESQLEIHNNIIQKYNLIFKNKDNSEFLLSLEYQNLAYSYEIAKFLKFDTYNVLDTDNTVDKDDKKNKIININKNIEKIFIVSLKNLLLIDTNNIFTITNEKNIKTIFDKKIKVNNKNEFSIFFDKINNTLKDLYRRPDNTPNLIINFLYLNDNILKKNLLLYDVNILDNLVSKKWILYYELFYNTRIFNDNDTIINIFIYGENSITLLNVINFYNTKWNKNTVINFKLGSLLPNNNNIDKYHNIYSEFNDKWLFGDITNNKDIKKYQKFISSNKPMVDWIIIDCNVENYFVENYNKENYNKDNENDLGFKQILFILNNLRYDGNCIIKLSLRDQNKLLIDMIYLLYNNFNIIEFYIQNTDVSGEIYMICKKYKKILTEKQIDILFKIDKENSSSFISKYSDEFNTDYANMLTYLSSIYINNIDNIKYYIDFWHVIKDENKVDLMNIINNKNHIWIKKYIQKN
jgi:hypothetical protein